MEDWQKTLFFIIGTIIIVILVISGINAIIFVIITRNELGFVSAYLLLGQNMNWAVLVGIYIGSRPNLNIFIMGIVLIVIGFIGFFIIIGKSRSYLTSKLTKRQKTILKPILIIICIVSIIIGGVYVFYTHRNRFSVNIFMLMILLLFTNKENLLLSILFYEMLKPYSSTVISGFFMIGIGIAGLILQAILYESSIISSKKASYEYTRPFRRSEPVITYMRRPKRKITIKKCPACHAPLRKKPPCECEYCGAILE